MEVGQTNDFALRWADKLYLRTTLRAKCCTSFHRDWEGVNCTGLWVHCRLLLHHWRFLVAAIAAILVLPAEVGTDCYNNSNTSKHTLHGPISRGDEQMKMGFQQSAGKTSVVAMTLLLMSPEKQLVLTYLPIQIPSLLFLTA